MLGEVKRVEIAFLPYMRGTCAIGTADVTLDRVCKRWSTDDEVNHSLNDSRPFLKQQGQCVRMVRDVAFADSSTRCECAEDNQCN